MQMGIIEPSADKLTLQISFLIIPILFSLMITAAENEVAVFHDESLSHLRSVIYCSVVI